MLTELIALNEAVCHFYSFGFHGVLLAEVVVGDRIVVQIADSSHAALLKYYGIKLFLNSLISYRHSFIISLSSMLLEEDLQLYPAEEHKFKVHSVLSRLLLPSPTSYRRRLLSQATLPMS